MISSRTDTAPTDAGSFELALASAIDVRSQCFDSRHETAFRLFNGFYEGWTDFVADLYGHTLVLHNYAEPPATVTTLVDRAVAFYRTRLPWLRAILVKARYSDDEEAKKGVIVWGELLDRHVRENGIWFAVDLRLNQDASFYLDTRNLRKWAKANLAGKTVLNTFAYTGSLGVAAKAGGAERVVHLDLSRAFLNIAKDSYVRNGFPINRADFVVGDFWPEVSRLKRESARFDCVIVDPPLFSRTRRGTVDLADANRNVLNKIRPLIADGGYLVTINNALFVSGAAYMEMLNGLCVDGYVTIDALIPVPQDFLGAATPSIRGLPTDPSPFNHPTKIAVLRVRRKAA